MNGRKQRTLVTTLILASFLFFGKAYAEDKTTPTQAHKEHHPVANTPASSKSSAESDTTENGKMNMSGMKGMMHECMQMHKDGKMCNHHTMEKCQQKMGKAECKKMMKQMTSKKKSEMKK